MLKLNKIAVPFLLFASIVFLAQAVIPHHHHENDIVCIEITHCETDDQCHKDLPTHEQHQGQEDEDICSFDLVILSTNLKVFQKKKITGGEKSFLPQINNSGIKAIDFFKHSSHKINNNLPPPFIINKYIYTKPEFRGPPAC